jgi:hypothetical protein
VEALEGISTSMRSNGDKLWSTPVHVDVEAIETFIALGLFGILGVAWGLSRHFLCLLRINQIP